MARWSVGPMIVIATIAMSPSSAVRAQGGGQGLRFGSLTDCADPPTTKNVPYDGQFTFVRLKYKGSPGNCYYRGEPSWAHGYGYAEKGTADMNLMKIVSEISVMRPHLDATNVIAREYLAGFVDANVDTLVLGCTHYPLLKRAIGEVVGRSVRLIGGASDAVGPRHG